MLSPHFQGKEALRHVVETQAQGFIDSREVHGTEMPDHVSAGANTAKEICIAVLLIGLFVEHLGTSAISPLLFIGIFGISWLVWRVGRSAWIGWARLERLHRLVEQEQWEIEHHRDQERAELKALYAARGFEGQLLEEVVDVLMADGDRLLRVMLEEELHLRLEVHEHPLKQGLGALVGGLVGLGVCLVGQWLSPIWGAFFGALLVVAISSGYASRYIGNRVIPAVVWNVGIVVVAYGSCRFLLDLLTLKGA